MGILQISVESTFSLKASINPGTPETQDIDYDATYLDLVKKEFLLHSDQEGSGGENVYTLKARQPGLTKIVITTTTPSGKYKSVYTVQIVSTYPVQMEST